MAAPSQTLLILEDSDDISRRLTAAAERKGYRVVTYKDATGILVMARQLQPDAIVLDGTLRGAGAVMAVKAIKRNVHTTSVPIIAVTSRTGATPEGLVDAGANAALAEPVDAAGILRAVQEHERAELDFSAAPAVVAQALGEPPRAQAIQEAGRVLESVPDAAFDRLALLASRLLVAPVSVATFVDQKRQFFKGQQGLGEPWASARETPLSHSFCQWVVSSDEALVIDDSSRHAVLRQNQAVQALAVKAYAGVPVAGKGGATIGSMCAIDAKARAWKPEDLKTLEDLARVAEAYAVPDLGRVRNAIHAATRMLRRYGARLRDNEREELLAIVDEQAGRLAGA